MSNSKTPLKTARSQFRSILGWLALFSFGVNMLLLVMPLYMLQIYDRVLPAQSMETLLFLSLIAAGSLVVLGLLEAVRAIIAARAAARLDVTLGGEALRMAILRGRATGGDIQAVRNLALTRNFIASRTLFSLLDLPFSPIFIAILYFIHPLLFWITLGGTIVLFAIALLNQWVTSAPSATANRQQSGSMLAAQAFSRNADTILAMGMVGNGVAKWGETNAGALNSQGHVDTRNAIIIGLSRTLRMGLQVATLGVGAWLVLTGEISAGMIFASSIVAGRALQPIDQVIGGWKQFAGARGAWEELVKLLEQAPAPHQRMEMDRPDGAVRVGHASVFAPANTGGAPILSRVHFSVEPGTIVGIVGASGSGKSTLARVLVGAQPVNSGTVRLDGNDIRNWAPEQVGAAIGYLGQEPELLPGTVKDNIARLLPNAPDKAVRDAAKRAQVHDLIQTFPHGYDTWIGPGGLQLSGGQKQRVALARAFFGAPRLLVLDEPDANLDAKGQEALFGALQAARESGATVFIVTQRHNVLAFVDKVMRVTDGQIDFFDTQQAFAAAIQSAKNGTPAGFPAKGGVAGQRAAAGASSEPHNATRTGGVPVQGRFVGGIRPASKKSVARHERFDRLTR